MSHPLAPGNLPVLGSAEASVNIYLPSSVPSVWSLCGPVYRLPDGPLCSVQSKSSSLPFNTETGNNRSVICWFSRGPLTQRALPSLTLFERNRSIAALKVIPRISRAGRGWLIGVVFTIIWHVAHKLAGDTGTAVCAPEVGRLITHGRRSRLVAVEELYVIDSHTACKKVTLIHPLIGRALIVSTLIGRDCSQIHSDWMRL